MKSLQDELSNSYITFAYEYNKYFTFMMLVSSWMVSYGNFFVVDLFEPYIVQWKSNVDVIIWTKIQ